MKKFLWALGLLACLTASQVASAQPKAERKSHPTISLVMGAGNSTCGTYLEDRRENSPVQSAIYFSWIQGYLTGLNSASNKTNIVGVVQADAFAYLDKYCRENPLKPIFSGIQALYLEVGGDAITR